ncbi:hypothetical protein BDC45DRAFT_493290 [Circinella umbellata]|nr:hypothetical protein BDC45DRAFT_493290 [Circinella umbellata]
MVLFSVFINNVCFFLFTSSFYQLPLSVFPSNYFHNLSMINHSFLFFCSLFPVSLSFREECLPLTNQLSIFV